MADEQAPTNGSSAPLSPSPPGLPAAPPLPVQPGWHRLHPLSPMVRAGRGLVVLVVALLFASVRRGHPDYGELVGDGVVVVVLLAAGVVSWLVTRWQVVDGVLRVETGLLRRSSQRYPLSQVQAIDIVATGIARFLGLAELRLRMAGGATRGGGRLQCVRAADAEGLRASLLAAGRATTPAPSATVDRPVAAPPPPLYRLPTGRLLASVLLSRLGLVTVVASCAVVLTVLLGPPAAAGAVGGSSALALGVLTNLYRRVNGEYGMAVTVAPDGMQLRSGLVELSTETIPIARIQAVRMVEPPLWRPFGWCRVEVEVAGKRVREENASTGRERRALLPAGPRDLARRLVAEVIDDLPVADHPAPRRARWKAPLSYRWLAVGSNDRYVVTTNGRVARVHHWVPLEKVQSIRQVQGPVQRALGLGSIHLDTAGRSMHAVLKDRDWTQLQDELVRLAALCRAARRP